MPRSTAQPVTAWTAAVGVAVVNSTRPSATTAPAGRTPPRSRGRVPAGRSKRTTVVPEPPISSSGVPSATSRPAGEHADAVREVLGLVEVVRRQQHGRPARAQLADELPRLAPGRRVEAGRRLVEEQQRRGADDAERQVEASALAARQVPDALVELRRQADELDGIGRPAAACGSTSRRSSRPRGPSARARRRTTAARCRCGRGSPGRPGRGPGRAP